MRVRCWVDLHFRLTFSPASTPCRILSVQDRKRNINVQVTLTIYEWPFLSDTWIHDCTVSFLHAWFLVSVSVKHFLTKILILFGAIKSRWKWEFCDPLNSSENSQLPFHLLEPNRKLQFYENVPPPALLPLPKIDKSLNALKATRLHL